MRNDECQESIEAGREALENARRAGAADGATIARVDHCEQQCAELLEEQQARGVLALDPWADAYCRSCCEACAERADTDRTLELDHGMVVEGVHCRVVDAANDCAEPEGRLRFSLAPLLRDAIAAWYAQAYRAA
ncbi:MAG: hypothetical protein OXT09_21770 [Myxococcales bacterium]|nr:hypothetical protein [Myxococcales bacterium]